jgi:hypothetical protein
MVMLSAIHEKFRPNALPLVGLDYRYPIALADSLPDQRPEEKQPATRRNIMGRREMTYDRKYAGLEPWSPGYKSHGYSPTDAALYLAIAHVWLSEGIYDEHAKARTVGFERFRGYVLGYQDGIPKRPRWAAPISGVPSYTIKALARHWAEACPTGAFAFWSEEDLAELISKAELLHTELAPRPRAACCAGLPNTFIGGTVYDYEADEVIEGALVTLRLSDDIPGAESTRGAELTVATDEFGNFLVDGPERGTYLVMIEKEGYIPRELGPLKAEDDLNLGDFALFLDSKGLIW